VITIEGIITSLILTHRIGCCALVDDVTLPIPDRPVSHFNLWFTMAEAALGAHWTDGECLDTSYP
jgi:hypothetical protein